METARSRCVLGFCPLHSLSIFACILLFGTFCFAEGKNQDGESEPASHRRYEKRTFTDRFEYHGRWAWQEPSDFLIARYNRVEGAFLGVRLPNNRPYRSQFNRFNIFGEAGYGFDNKTWRYQIGGQLTFFSRLHSFVGAEYHNFTETQDAWLLPTGENNFYSLFFKEDYFDYYQSRGWSAFLVQELSGTMKLKVAYGSDQQRSMIKTTNWAVFYGDQDFRLNPAIDEGRLNRIRVVLSFDNRDDWQPFESGWRLKASADISGEGLGGDFDFGRYVLDLRRFQRIGHRQNFDVRLRIGSSRGEVPEQYLFDLGGISTLPGFFYKEFTGNRMVLINPEYRTAGRNLFGDVPLLEEFTYIIFADAGYAWFSEDNSSALQFSNFSFSDLKSDLGFAISTRSGHLRLIFAQRLDDRNRGPSVSFRFHRPF